MICCGQLQSISTHFDNRNNNSFKKRKKKKNENKKQILSQNRFNHFMSMLCNKILDQFQSKYKQAQMLNIL